MEVKNKKQQFNHKCKCCLEDGRLRDMWGHYYREDGQEEVYGDMLNKCFALAWHEPSEYMEQICTTCMTQLRAAFSFKKQVLSSEQIFLENMEEDEDDVIETSGHEYNKEAQQDTVEAIIKEKADIDQPAVHSELNVKYFKAADTMVVIDNDDDYDDGEFLGDENINSGSKEEMDNGNLKRKRNSAEQLHNLGTEKKKKADMSQACLDALRRKPHVLLEKMSGTKEAQYVSEKYTEDETTTAKNQYQESKIKKHSKENHRPWTETVESESTTEVKSREENPTNKKNGLVNRNLIGYTFRKGYTETDLQRGIEDVVKKRMTFQMAATHYNIPVSTLYQRIARNGLHVSGKRRQKHRQFPTPYSKIIKNQDMEGKKRRGRKPMMPIISKVIMSEDMEGAAESSENPAAISQIVSTYKNQVNNIEVILLFSNATPIQTHRASGYKCCFCTDFFPKPADLKQHTLEKHKINVIIRYIKKNFCSFVDKFINLDITDLQCNICKDTPKTVDSLIEHLNIEHNHVLHTNVKNLIYPFKFFNDADFIQCVICDIQFHSFRKMLGHMNCHFRYFNCPDCNRGYSTKVKLRMHQYYYHNAV